MRTRMMSGVFYALVLIGALALNATFAQSVPTMGPDGWVLPVNEPSAPIQVVPAAQGSYEAEIYAACAVHGCDPQQLIRVMDCESGGDPGAWHANPYGGADVGIFQINDATWGDIAYADPYTQIWWAAEMFANGGAGHWVCK